MPTNLAGLLAGEVLTLAFCTLVTRQDGVKLGFTSTDKDLVIDGITYEANSGASPSAIRSSVGTGVDNMDFAGALNSDRLHEVDLEAGLYDGATIEAFLVDWSVRPITERLILVSGFLGEVRLVDGQYTVEVRGLAQRLQQSIGKLTGPKCRVRALFDEECSPPGNTTPTATPANFRFNRSVQSVTSPTVLVFAGDMQPDDDYFYGRVRFTTGQNAGMDRMVVKHKQASGTAVVTLRFPFPFAVAVGDVAMLEVGCNRTKKRCHDRFSNVVNGRYEPEVPGIDRLVQIGRQ